MDVSNRPYRENEMLRERLSRLSAASLRINESLNVDAALQGVLDSARSLTAAPYASIITLDGAGAVEEHDRLLRGCGAPASRETCGRCAPT